MGAHWEVLLHWQLFPAVPAVADAPIRTNPTDSRAGPHLSIWDLQPDLDHLAPLARWAALVRAWKWNKQPKRRSVFYIYLVIFVKTLTALSIAQWAMLIFASGFRLIIARWLIAQFHLGRKFVQWTCKVQHNMQLLRGHGFQQTCIYFALKHRPKLTKQTPLVSARWPRPILDTVTAIFKLLVLFSSHQMSSLLILTRLTINTSLC